MAVNIDLLDTIRILIQETEHSPADVLESLVVIAGCTLQACCLTELSVTNEVGMTTFTITQTKVKK